MLRKLTWAAAFSLAFAAHVTPASAVPASNECSGGNGGFSSCTLDGFGAIYKFEVDNGKIETSGMYLTIGGGEFSITYDDKKSKSSGTWTYTPDADDPELAKLVAKAGNTYLTFDIADILTGTWSTPEGKQLSHITFFGAAAVAPVPLPAAGLMLIAAIGGLGAVRLRRRKAAA